MKNDSNKDNLRNPLGNENQMRTTLQRTTFLMPSYFYLKYKLYFSFLHKVTKWVQPKTTTT